MLRDLNYVRTPGVSSSFAPEYVNPRAHDVNVRSFRSEYVRLYAVVIKLKIGKYYCLSP